jgi:LacI family transcriptional regulator
MLNGAEQVLRQHGYRVQFASTDRSIEEENRLLRLLMHDGAVGCILVPSRASTTGRLLMTPEFNLPVVLMDRPINGMVLPCVCSNNYEGGLQAMEHLIALGHREIIFLARPHLDLWPVSERYRAYQDTLRRHEAQPQPPFLVGGGSEMSSYEAYLQEDDSEIEPLVELLQSSQRPTAIFAVNDWMALKAQRAIQLAGLRNPEDVSLVGFDDLDIAEFQSPPLTTVAQNAALMGAEAARRLITRLEGEENESILTLVPTHLVVRSSTAPPP